jgi:hypothetical protein
MMRCRPKCAPPHVAERGTPQLAVPTYQYGSVHAVPEAGHQQCAKRSSQRESGRLIAAHQRTATTLTGSLNGDPELDHALV